MKESKVPVGEFYKTGNGNIYLALPNDEAAYVCNENFEASAVKSAIVPRQNFDVEIITHEQLKELL